MGRIKTVLIKRIGKDLVEKHHEKFKPNFEYNKPVVGKFLGNTSKKMKNIIAGYVTRLMRRSQ